MWYAAAKEVSIYMFFGWLNSKKYLATVFKLINTDKT